MNLQDSGGMRIDHWTAGTGSLLALLLLIPGSVAAQADLTYRERGAGDQKRFEGRAPNPVAAPSFDLLSFTANEPRLAAGAAMLFAQFRMPSNGKARLLVREIIPREYYRMSPQRTEWSAGLNTFKWPTADVLARMPIDYRNLGALAVLADTQTSALLAPVSLGTTATPQRADYYVLRFSSKYDVEFCDVDVSPEDDPKAARRYHLKEVAGGASQTLVVRPRSDRPGYYTIFLDCYYKGRRGGPQYEIRFRHGN